MECSHRTKHLLTVFFSFSFFLLVVFHRVYIGLYMYACFSHIFFYHKLVNKDLYNGVFTPDALWCVIMRHVASFRRLTATHRTTSGVNGPYGCTWSIAAPLNEQWQEGNDLCGPTQQPQRTDGRSWTSDQFDGRKCRLTRQSATAKVVRSSAAA